MHRNPFTKQFTKMIAIGSVALVAMSPAAIAEGRYNRPQVDLSGTGTYEMDEFDIFVRGAGNVRGVPFDGAATFTLRADDGTLPGPDECEDGGANFAVRGKKRQHLWGVSVGEICGRSVQEPTDVTTHVFTGEYSIVESSKRLRDIEGWIEIRLATDNRMAITLFDS